MKILNQLFAILADGRFHSGEALSKQLGVSRSSIWNAMEKLKSMGLEIFAVKGQGYRLAEATEPLDKDRILQTMDIRYRAHVPHVDVHWSLDSTNGYLMELAKYGAQSGHSCLAEFQTAGRGRRGRTWISPFGGNVYLSQLWRFQCGPAGLGGLSLAVAVAVARCLQNLGITGFQLKWPNDILFNGKKLAGILLEIAGEAVGPTSVVAGVGINVQMNDQAAKDIDQPWTDLRSICKAKLSRNRLVGQLLSELVKMHQEYEQKGLAPFLEEWQRYDGCFGRPVRLLMHDTEIVGIARGVDAGGALKLEVAGTIRLFHSGEISLRAAN